MSFNPQDYWNICRYNNMKPGYRILVSIYVAFIVYTLVVLVWGAAGILETSRLKDYKDKLLQNTIELSQISNQLAIQSNRLRTEQRLIKLKARDLGFFDDGEGQVIIRGYHKNNINYSVGSYYKRFNKEIGNINYFRLFSIIAGLIMFLLLSVLKNNSIYKK